MARFGLPGTRRQIADRTRERESWAERELNDSARKINIH